MNIFDLSGKVAVVTGGYGHLGKAMAEALVNQGAITVVAGRSRTKFFEAFGERPSTNLFFKELDILDTASVSQVFNELQGEFGRVDILVNNAHSSKGKSIENMPDADWAFTIEGVLGSVHRCIRAVLPIMKKHNRGKIINISSMYGMVSPNFDLYEGNCEPYTNPPHYGAAKAGVLQLTRYYAFYLGKYNVQVNAITPGPFPKPVIQNENPEFVRRLKDRNPLNKIGKPEDLAGVTVLLSSGASDFITGQNIVVDGGWTIW